MCRVTFKGANLLKVSLVTAAAMLAISLLALVETANTAEAKDSLPENGKIAFHSADEGSIYVVNADGTGRTNVTPDDASTSTTTNITPAWSPDGTKIAFSSNMKPSRSPLYHLEIYVMDADGSHLRRLTKNRTDDTESAWSPDGTKIAYAGFGETRHGFEIYTVNADGSDQTRLTNNPERDKDINAYGDLTRYRDNFGPPDWLPDGKKIGFWVDSKPGGSGIYTMNPDGSNQTLVTADGDQADWSPDGTKMVYRRSPPGQSHTDIFIANADGSNPVNLTASMSNTSYEAEPAWSPDGTKIAFSSNRGEKIATDYEIYVIDANGRNLKRLTHTPGTPGTNGAPDWQPLPEPTPPKSRSMTVHPPDTGGPSLLLVASALFFSVGRLLYAMVRRRM